MKKFRKKPVVIEAIEWNGTTTRYEQILKEAGCDVVSLDEAKVVVQIRTLEGVMMANVGDWVIKGVNGEFYPCKPDIFAKTYEAVEGGADETA